jgi:hypothetical protein
MRGIVQVARAALYFLLELALGAPEAADSALAGLSALMVTDQMGSALAGDR